MHACAYIWFCAHNLAVSNSDELNTWLCQHPRAVRSSNIPCFKTWEGGISLTFSSQKASFLEGNGFTDLLTKPIEEYCRSIS